MNSIAISLYAPWLYTILSYVDYMCNRKDYVCSKYLPGAFDQLIQNIFIWIPASIYILLIFFPSINAIKQWYIEIGMLAMEFNKYIHDHPNCIDLIRCEEKPLSSMKLSQPLCLAFE